MSELYIETLKQRLDGAQRAIQDLMKAPEIMEVFSMVVGKVVSSYQKGGRLYIAGNGGSAADAQHLAAEFVSKLAKPRAPLPAEALTVDTSILTAIGNDFSFDEIFSRPLVAKLRAEDCFLGITTSGKSMNIVRALEVCRDKKVPSIVLTGWDGGQVKELADYCVIVPGRSTSEIQQMHQIVYHTLCECVENELFG